MTATEELRRMLDERGVEWHGDIATYWRSADAVESLFADNALDVSLYAVSPERAIAATLGRGMLTADDVRDLIEQHSDASGGNGRDFHNGAYAAIADELNATLWRGTCHDVGKAGCGAALSAGAGCISTETICRTCGLTAWQACRATAPTAGGGWSSESVDS